MREVFRHNLVTYAREIHATLIARPRHRNIRHLADLPWPPLHHDDAIRQQHRISTSWVVRIIVMRSCSEMLCNSNCKRARVSASSTPKAHQARARASAAGSRARAKSRHAPPFRPTADTDNSTHNPSDRGRSPTTISLESDDHDRLYKLISGMVTLQIANISARISCYIISKSQRNKGFMI